MPERRARQHKRACHMRANPRPKLRELSMITVLRWVTWSVAALVRVAIGGSCRLVLGRYRSHASPHRRQGRGHCGSGAVCAAGRQRAGMGVQPTPFGMATVEERIGEVSRNKVDAVRDAMARARAANAAANTPPIGACEKALAEVRRIMRALRRWPASPCCSAVAISVDLKRGANGLWSVTGYSLAIFALICLCRRCFQCPLPLRVRNPGRRWAR